MSDGFTFEVNADDGGSFDALADELVRKIDAAFGEVGNDITSDLRRIAQQHGRALQRHVTDQIRQAARASDQLSAGMRRSAQATRAAQDAVGDLLKDAQALQRTISAQAKTKNAFIDPEEFALLNRSIEKLQAFQARSRLVDPADTKAVRQLRLEFGALAAEATKAKGEIQTRTRSLTAQGIADIRRQQQVERQADRERLVELQKASSQAKFIAQREQQAILSDVQRSNARRVQLTRFMFESLGRLERGLGTVIQGTARTATRGIARIYSDTLGRVSALFVRNGQTIRNITQSSSDSRFSILRRSFSREERLLQQSMSRQQQIIQRTAAQAQTGVIGVARRSTLLGLGGGLAGLGLFSAGLERFSNLERLTKQFTALTGSAEDAATVLAQVREFARITPFDLVGVADLAKGFLAIKTPVDQVLPRVRAIADAVALTGGGVDELNRIQRALGQIVSAGRLQGDELNQLAENLPGLNIRQILADQLTGGDVQALVALQEAGKLSADAVVNGLITGLATDPRLAGASEDLAKTLGGRLANLKEVVADVGASFIGLIADPMKEAIKQATVALDGLSAFIKGEVGPALQVLRTGIGGAAAAIGALVVAKVAAESLKLLAGSARLLLTPFGSIVAIVGGLGAAIAIMRDRSEEFREVTDRLVSLLRTTVGNVFESVARTFERVRDAFRSAHEPIIGTADALERASEPARSFISTIGRGLADAIATAGRFLTNTLIPAIGDFAILVGRNLGPAIAFVREQVGNLASTVGSAATAAFDKLKPKLETARGLLGEVADSVRAVVSGVSSFTTLLPTAGAALIGGLAFGPVGALVAGVATGLATLSPTLRNTIVEGVRGAVEGIRNLFNGIDWAGLALRASEFVRTLGRVLGSIVSDPRFVAAIGAIAGTAALIGVQFVRGFAEGVIANLDELAQLGADIADTILRGILGFALSNPLDFLAILGGSAALGAILVVGRDMGRQLSAGFDQGFRTGLRTIRGLTTSGADFLSGALGFNAGNFQRQARNAALSAQQAIETEFRRLNRALGASGFTQVAIAPGGRASQADLDAARANYGRLTSQIGEAAAAGTRFRLAISDAFTSIRNNQAGIRGIFSSIGQGLGDARAAIKGQGAAIGTALGVGISGAFASAMGGSQLAAGNTAAGLGAILVSSLLTGAAIGGAPGLVAGGVVGALGLATAAVKQAGEAAKIAKEQIAGFRDVFLEAARAGADAAPRIIEEIFNSLIDLAPEVRDALVQVGVTAEDVFDFAGLDSTVRDQFHDATRQINDLGEVTRGTKAEQYELEEALAAVARVSDADARTALGALVQAYVDGKIDGDALAKTVDALKNTIFSSAEAARQAGIDIKLLGEETRDAEASTNVFGEGFSVLAGRIDEAIGVMDLAGTAASDLKAATDAAISSVDKLLNPTAGTIQEELERALGSLSGVASQVQAGLDLGGLLGSAEVNQALSGFQGSIADVIQQGLRDGLTESDIDNRLRFLQAGIAELNLPSDVADKLNAEVQAAIDADIPELPTPTINEDEAREVGRALTRAAASGASEGDLESEGSSLTEGFARGMTFQNVLDKVQAAARRLVNLAKNTATTNLKISSPSRVFEEIGAQTAEGFSLGIINNLGFVTTAGTQMSQALIDATRGALEDLNAEISASRSSLLERLLGGEAGSDAARRNIQSALTGLTEGLADPIREALESGIAPNLRFDIAGGNANRNVLAGLVEDIKGLFGDLLESGVSPTSAIAEALQARAQALDIATFLGFDRAGVDAFFSALGLSSQSLEAFGSQMLTETERLKKEAEEREFTRLRDEQGAATGGGSEVNINGDMVFNLPYAQPEAIALTVANRIARSV